MFDFFLNSLLKNKLKDFPPEIQEKILSVAKNNPELLTKIVSEVQEKIKNGAPQKQAMEDVAKNHKEELAKILKSDS